MISLQNWQKLATSFPSFKLDDGSAQAVPSRTACADAGAGRAGRTAKATRGNDTPIPACVPAPCACSPPEGCWPPTPRLAESPARGLGRGRLLAGDGPRLEPRGGRGVE